MSIEIANLHKRFGQHTILENLNLKVETGQLVALLGPSGSGKTTILRIIAGLEQADAGTVILNGRDTTQDPLDKRRVGFVFQHYALFRHMTIFENVAFGLQVRPRAQRPSKKDISDRVRELLSLVQLDWVADRYPHQLSGGQRQRVALARALAVEPEVLLLDEPFGALDAKVRAELRRWLRKLHDDTGITSLFVTHDQEEALEVADRIAVLHQGRLEQEGTPEEVYEHPANPFVFHFLGDVNLFHGRVHQGQAELAGVSLPAPGHEGAENAPAVAFVRPHDVELSREPEPGALVAEITSIHSFGPLARVQLRDHQAERDLEAALPLERLRALRLTLGEVVFVTPRQAKVFLDQPTEATGTWGI
ncbi:MAG: cysA [Holophagaceae bacterium]|nr:cysA [Holophagaceae bacterium]